MHLNIYMITNVIPIILFVIYIIFFQINFDFNNYIYDF